MKQSLLRYCCRVTAWLSVSLLTSVCSPQHKDQLATLDIEKGIQNGSSPLLSDYCSSLEYIPLQTDSSALLSDFIRQLTCLGENYFFFIEHNSRQGKLFNKEGKFLTNIGAHGNAKGEYRNPMGVFLDETKGEIIINDINKLISYDLTGKMIKEITLDSLNKEGQFLYSINSLGERAYTVSRSSFENEPSVAFINDKGEILHLYEEFRPVSGMSPAPETDVKIVEPMHTYMYDGKLHLVTSTNDTVFCFNAAFEKQPSYIKKFGRYKLLPNESNRERSVTILGSVIQETAGALFFQLMINGNKFSYSRPNSQFLEAIYDKKTGIVSGIAYDPEFKSVGLKNDIDGGAPFWPSQVSGTKMYQMINAFKFIEMSKAGKSAKMKEIAANLTEDSNPVLVVADLK